MHSALADIVVPPILLGWLKAPNMTPTNLILFSYFYLAPHRGRARYCNAHVCLSVCVSVCVFVCVFVCPCFRQISMCQNISVISQPIIMKLGIHITYGYTVTDKYFQNFRLKVKVVGRRKVKNVIWPYLRNEWS